MIPYPKRARVSTKQGYANNRVISHLRIDRQRYAPGVLLTITQQGTFARPQIPIVPAGTVDSADDIVSLFTIKAIVTGSLTCRETYVLDAATGTYGESDEDTTVVMPESLSATGGGINQTSAQSRTRHLTVDGVTGDLVEGIEPLYTVGEIIVAAFIGVEGRSDAGIDLHKFWQDLNVDARHWVESLRTVNVCVNINGTPTTRKMFIRGSAPFV